MRLGWFFKNAICCLRYVIDCGTLDGQLRCVVAGWRRWWGRGAAVVSRKPIDGRRQSVGTGLASPGEGSWAGRGQRWPNALPPRRRSKNPQPGLHSALLAGGQLQASQRGRAHRRLSRRRCPRRRGQHSARTARRRPRPGKEVLRHCTAPGRLTCCLASLLGFGSTPPWTGRQPPEPHLRYCTYSFSYPAGCRSTENLLTIS